MNEETGESVRRIMDGWVKGRTSPPIMALVEAVASTVSASLQHGYGEETVARALTLADERGISVNERSPLWGECLMIADKQIKDWGGSRLDPRVAAASRLLQRFGWPTGSRFVRSEYSGTYIQHPLGYEKPDYSVPWERPDIEAIRDAVAADSELKAHLLAEPVEERWVWKHLRMP